MKKKLIIAISVIVLIAIAAVLLITKGMGEKTTSSREDQTETSLTSEQVKTSGEGGLECTVGSLWTEIGTTYKITGFEKYTLAGKSMDFCCAEVTQQEQKSKYCWADENKSYSITWMTDVITKKLFKYMEIWEEDDKQCTKVYDSEGSVMTEMCE